MIDQQSSYRQLFKAASIFGGVQVFTMTINIVRLKLIAILIGPYGMGIVSLLNGSLAFVKSISDFSLERSSVRTIAQANSHNDSARIAIVIKVLNHLVFFTGVIGSLIIIFGSSFLSEFSFGNSEYKASFIWLGISIFLNQLTSGKNSILRGLRMIKLMAISSMLGSIFSLLISIPIYYFYGISGIVPSLILSPLTAFMVSYFFSKKLNLNKIKVVFADYMNEGKVMITLGFYLSISSILVLGTSFVISAFIRTNGTVADVGLYNAGFTIVNAYFGVFFTALSSDYYPKLASISNDSLKSNALMNQQSEMTLLIISPILSIFLVCVDLIISLLYTKEFQQIDIMILYAGLGIYFKASSYALGIIFVSKGHTLFVLLTEIVTNLSSFLIVYFFFNHLGIMGLGLSFLFSYVITYLFTFFAVKFKYGFNYDSDFYKIFFTQFLFGALSVIIYLYFIELYRYIFGASIVVLSTLFSLFYLDKRMGVFKLIKQNFNK